VNCRVPKNKRPEIADFLRDILEAKQRGIHKHGLWFWNLSPFFDRVLGSGEREKAVDFWKDFNAEHTVSKKHLEGILRMVRSRLPIFGANGASPRDFD
jgi:hypothetical protein